MITVHFVINGIRRANPLAWPAVPRVGESLEFAGTKGSWKVTRVHWRADGSMLSADVHLRPAHSQL